MTTSTLSTIEQSIHKTNKWIEELGQELHCESNHAYKALRAVLHTLRARMTIQEASDLGAQLPMLVRGIYYEGFNPSAQPTKESDKHSFLESVGRELVGASEADAEQATKSVFRLLSVHCTAGQIAHVKSQLPKEVQALWPT